MNDTHDVTHLLPHGRPADREGRRAEWSVADYARSAAAAAAAADDDDDYYDLQLCNPSRIDHDTGFYRAMHVGL